MKMNGINPATSRKFKYGAMAIILTAVVVAAVVIFNVIFSALAYKYYWYLDMTEEGLYGLTDEGRAKLDEITSDINIIFCCPYDELESNFYQKLVYDLVREMASSYDNINYSYIDIINNPTAVAKYKTTTSTTLKTTNVIVESGTEFRVFALEAFFTFNESNVVWAFNGEKKFVSAMIQVTQAETPIAYYTYTHGESMTNFYNMALLFEEAGYELLPIDLTQEDFDEDGRLLVIYNPIYDFQGISEDTKGKKSEIEKIDDFLDDFGNVMVFMDPDTEELPELEEFLSEWGISFDDSLLKDPSNSLDVEHYSLVATYSVEETVGASLVSSIVETGTPPKTIVNYARPINLLWDAKDNRTASTVLYSSDGAQKYVDGKVVDEGQFSLVTLSREARYIDNTPHYSYVFACGSQYFGSSDYLSQKAYGNSDIIYAMMRAMGKIQVPSDLELKVFDDESLDITTAEAANWTIFLTAFVPVCFLVAGVVVWIRRKHA